jgi:hypothetical protein
LVLDKGILVRVKAITVAVLKDGTLDGTLRADEDPAFNLSITLSLGGEHQGDGTNGVEVSRALEVSPCELELNLVQRRSTGNTAGNRGDSSIGISNLDDEIVRKIGTNVDAHASSDGIQVDIEIEITIGSVVSSLLDTVETELKAGRAHNTLGNREESTVDRGLGERVVVAAVGLLGTLHVYLTLSSKDHSALSSVYLDGTVLPVQRRIQEERTGG